MDMGYSGNYSSDCTPRKSRKGTLSVAANSMDAKSLCYTAVVRIKGALIVPRLKSGCAINWLMLEFYCSRGEQMTMACRPG